MASTAQTPGGGAGAVDTAGEQAPPMPDNCLGHVLVSVASESTGKAQTCRNELYALFGIWVGWADKTLPKQAREDQDKALRDEARRLYVGELLKRGVAVAYQRFANGTQSVTVSWDGMKMEREVKNDGRSAARNSFVALLRKRIETQKTHLTTWPIPDRPQTDPWNGGEAPPLANPVGAGVDDAALQAQMLSAHSSGVYWPAPSSALAPAKPKSPVAGGGAAGDSVGPVKESQRPAGGGASAQVLTAILERAGGRGRARPDASDSVQDATGDAGIQQPGPDSVALLFATEADVRNGAVWEQWLGCAPPKSYTIYVHARHPDRVLTPLFKDSLVNEPAAGARGVDMDGALTPEPGDAGAQKQKHDSAAMSMDSIMVLLKEALKEPSNKWFMVLDDACLPMVAFGTFCKHMALHPTTSIFDFHPEKVQTDMLGILQFVTGVPALVRDAIKNKDLVAHSPIGTMLVRRDAEILADASSAVLREWERALSSGPLQDALFSPHGAQYFGHWMQQERTAAVLRAFEPQSMAAVPDEGEPSEDKTSVPSAASTQAPQSLRRSLCLSVDELFLFALLRHLSRLKHGEPQAHTKVVRVQHVFCVVLREACPADARARHAALPRADVHMCGHTAAPVPCRSTSSYTGDAALPWAIASARSRGPSAQPVMPRSPKSLCPGASTTSPCSAATLTPCSGSSFRTSRCDVCIDMWLHAHMHRGACEVVVHCGPLSISVVGGTTLWRACVRVFWLGDALWWWVAYRARCSGPSTRNRKQRNALRKKSRLGGCPFRCCRCFRPPRTPPPPWIPGCTSIWAGRGVSLRRVWGILRRWEQGGGVQVTGRCQRRASISCRGMTSVDW
jgi:hypothetical protein